MSAPVLSMVPPHATAVEHCVLGILLLYPDTLPVAMSRLEPKHFYLPVSQKVFVAMQWLYQQGQPVDTLTLRDRLKSTRQLSQCGGTVFLASLPEQAVGKAHLEVHIHILLEKYLLRELMQQGGNLHAIARSEEEDVFDLIDDQLSKLIKLRAGIHQHSSVHVSGVAQKNLELIDKLWKNEVSIVGISSGFKEFDAAISGLQQGMKLEVAGRPGMGKSAFVLSVINHVAIELGEPVALFSLEMPARQQELRLKSIRTGIPYSRLMVGKIHDHEWDLLRMETDRIAASPIYINDNGSLNVMELRARAMQLKQEHGIRLLVLDYLQLMNGSPDGNRSRNRENEISQISRATKQIALELDITVIEVSQLSRASESRTNKRPQLSDLRESGAIEQDADIVLFPFRPEYYGIEELESGRQSKGMAELIIAKHRNGPCKTIDVGFEGEVLAFRDH